MNGSSFRRENVEFAHEDCKLCAMVSEIALRNFRDTGSMKTKSTMDDHWAEVTPQTSRDF